MDKSYHRQNIHNYIPISYLRLFSLDEQIAVWCKKQRKVSDEYVNQVSSYLDYSFIHSGVNNLQPIEDLLSHIESNVVEIASELNSGVDEKTPVAYENKLTNTELDKAQIESTANLILV